MSTFDQVKEGLTRAWHTVIEGWRELVDHAGDALTRFHPRHGGEVQTAADRVVQQSPRWGVLAAEVSVDADSVHVDIEVPGMDPQDFQISVREDVLVISGEKRVSRERRDGQYHVLERAYGAFERAVRLPVEVDEGGANASYEHGVLRVTLPRSAAHRARRIEVKAG